MDTKKGEKIMKYIVTSYINPDLDGTSSMYAYAEFLRKTGQNSDYYIEGNPMHEVEIVCDIFNIALNPVSKIESNDKIIVVDTNYLKNIPEMKLENIVEFIDHHAITESKTICKNAKFHVEMVGAAATLVAEKFFKNKIEISRESAILLYYGIISNTINLKAKVTTRKDLEMAKWLKEKCTEISDEKIQEIFIKKSQMRDTLREEMEVQIAWKWGNKSITIGQLEYANVESFLGEYESEIRNVLRDVKQEKNLDYILVNCVDILNGYSIILALDEATEKVIADLLKVKFVNGKAKLDAFVLRKEIFLMLEACVE